MKGFQYYVISLSPFSGLACRYASLATERTLPKAMYKRAYLKIDKTFLKPISPFHILVFEIG